VQNRLEALDLRLCALDGAICLLALRNRSLDTRFGAFVVATALVKRLSRDDRLIDEFLSAFSHRTDDDRFAVKARFMDDYGREYMWVTVTAVDGQHIYGQLDNDPATVRAIRRGQPVRVLRSGLNDWLFTKGSERVGGFTVKVLERRASGDAA